MALVEELDSSGELNSSGNLDSVRWNNPIAPKGYCFGTESICHREDIVLSPAEYRGENHSHRASNSRRDGGGGGNEGDVFNVHPPGSGGRDSTKGGVVSAPDVRHD